MHRSRLKHLARLPAYGLVAVCVAAWLVGRLLSDRFAWSQPISWIPTPLLIAPVWIGVAMVISKRRRVARMQRSGSGRAWLLVALGVAMGAHLAFAELGLHRGLSGRGSTRTLRIVFWNQAGRELGDISPAFLRLDPDLFVLANRHSDTKTRDLAQAFIDTGEAHAAVGWPFDLFARVRVRRWASASLGLDGRSRMGDGSLREDPGWAAWFEVETDAGLLTLWAIDMPSDPRLARFPLARDAGLAIASWQGSVRVVGDDADLPSLAGVRGFPPADVIVGDFNIPRGSASLREFLRAAGAGAMRDAFADAGWGWERSWPRRLPVWAIDQCFVGRRVRATSFEAEDPGMGGHRALVVELRSAGDQEAAPQARADSAAASTAKTASTRPRWE